ncbi:MAG: hypothetical protein ACYTGZ_12755, partial [Planctomycetota bacterium]
MSYDSLADFMSDDFASRGFSQLDIASFFSMSGFAHDGSQYHVVLESDPDQGAGSEVFLVSYDSLADFMSGTFASRGFSQLDIAGSFSMGGFAYDGRQYHVVLESDIDEGAGSEVFLVSYDSLADFMSGTFASRGFSQLDIASFFSMSGFAYDGSQYHVVLESDPDQGAGSEVFRVSYDSLADFMSDDFASRGFSQL